MTPYNRSMHVAVILGDDAVTFTLRLQTGQMFERALQALINDRGRS